MSYVIAGKAIKVKRISTLKTKMEKIIPEYTMTLLTLSALGTIFAAVGAAVVSSGGSKKSSSTIPPIAETVKSESKEEADLSHKMLEIGYWVMIGILGPDWNIGS
ncbi:hypothetical protein TREMEDRAFT_59145 [Tremella mesenterica DSM 1558]|uniref:uncharacterized protein n=1 Tax=Tremella mesenterica (strain ATCC 24925 / CBS 8224 / DSM 1558 / NBRC 9311 / NRRL Y-6157 / RJB 2259-6 / UBC 559-6) TaxID=578456 RepID=UPI0003F4A3B1|nr:uncharacterized protein TREMEDRAFT_59145 [Tremella mesenterica DSM 1558]EIW72984.1 hypothetical protein TREMEDRAFT_59145 [Tremella mesenterica DSM 1558]